MQNSEERKQAFFDIMGRKKSLTQVSKELGIPRTTLTRILETEYGDTEDYRRYKNSLDKNQHSGGVKIKKSIKVYGNFEELEEFYLECQEYRERGMKDSEIYKLMGVSKATFYRKIDSYKQLRDGEVRLRVPESKEEFIELSTREKEEVIFRKVNASCKAKRKKELTREQFDQKLGEDLEFYAKERNEGLDYIKDRDSYITPDDYMFMIYMKPILFTYNLEDNIKPKMGEIDKLVGRRNANRIIKSDGAILESSSSRFACQVSILRDEELLESFINEPMNFRASPEKIYASIQYKKQHGNSVQEKAATRIMDIKGKIRQEVLLNFPLPTKYQKELEGEEVNETRR